MLSVCRPTSSRTLPTGPAGPLPWFAQQGLQRIWEASVLLLVLAPALAGLVPPAAGLVPTAFVVLAGFAMPLSGGLPTRRAGCRRPCCRRCDSLNQLPRMLGVSC